MLTDVTITIYIYCVFVYKYRLKNKQRGKHLKEYNTTAAGGEAD